MAFENKETVLLVGEGDFSFGVDFVQKVHPHKPVISSCLLSPGENLTTRQKENVTVITNYGGEVFTDVDARKLHQHPEISKRQIGLIIFNFPHVGGKMKIGENRKLLKEFFISAGQKLEDGKEVWVTLCSGQGGTPADQKQRHWSDSWQVTEMAAYGNFILTKTTPFKPEEYPSYRCVGYRSLEKGFHMKGAIVHTFLKHSAVKIDANPEFMKVPLPEGAFLVPNYFAMKLGKECHPIASVSAHLLQIITKLFPDGKGLERCSPLIQCGSQQQAAPDSILIISESEPKNDATSETFTLRTTLFDSHIADTIVKLCCSKKSSVFLSSTAFQNCPINDFSLPVKHGLIFACRTEDRMAFVQKLGNLLEEICRLVRPCDKQIQEILVSVTEDDCDLRLLNELAHEKAVFTTVRKEYQGSKWYQLPIEIVFQSSDSEKDDMPTVCVADLFRNPEHPFLSCLCIHLDVLAMCKFNISDWRLLWSDVFNKDGENVMYQQKSLYPPTYVHDVSFWSTDGNFNEFKFLLLVRNVLGDIVKEVKLIDSFFCKGTSRNSYCYRLCYQSVDCVLNRDICREIQLHLREMLAGFLNVELR